MYTVSLALWKDVGFIEREDVSPYSKAITLVQAVYALMIVSCGLWRRIFVLKGACDT